MRLVRGEGVGPGGGGEGVGGVGVGRGRKAFLFRLHYLKGKRRAVSGTGGNSGDPETFLMCLFTQKMLTT